MPGISNRFRRPALFALALLLVGSLSGNWLALRQLRRSYGDAALARIWPSGAEESSVASNTSPAGLLLAGDSRIAAWPTDQLPATNAVIAGVSGQTSAQFLLRLPKVLDQTRPEMIVIQIGINDLKALGVYPELRERIVRHCVSNIVSAADLCRQRGTRVVVTAIWPPGPVELARRFVWNDAVPDAVAEANQMLAAQLQSRAGVLFVDLFSATSAPPAASRAVLYQDALHLRPAAYRELAAPLRAAIQDWATPKNR